MTVVVAVAHPQFWYTFAVGAFELRLRVALPLVANALVLVASVGAVVVRVADPRIWHTAAS